MKYLDNYSMLFLNNLLCSNCMQHTEASFYCVLLCVKRFGVEERSLLGPNLYSPSQDRGQGRAAVQSLEQLCIPAFPRMWWVRLSWPFGVVSLMEITVQTQGSTKLGSRTVVGRHHNLSSCWALILFFASWIQCNRHERFVLRIRREISLTLVRQGPAVRKGRKWVQCIIVGKKQREEKVGEVKSEMDR